MRYDTMRHTGAMTDKGRQLLLAALTAAVLFPFLDKAYDIDDPLFLWMAQQILQHPLDPYGGTVFWASVAQPMWVAMQNPPLCSYYIAGIAFFAGFGEVAQHLAFLIPAIAAILGTAALAQRWSRQPLMAGLLTLFTPVFLISASHVMCDVMLLAFWTWAIHFWVSGLERGHTFRLVLSVLLISAAVLTKYFGVSLIPLLLTYTLSRERRFSSALFWLILPLLVLLVFELTTKAEYGHYLFTGAMLYLRHVAIEVRLPLQIKLLTGLSFLGGCMIGGLLLFPIRRPRWIPGAFVLLLFVGTLFWIFIPAAGGTAIDSLGIRLQGSLFATIGVALLALACWDFWVHRDAASLLLSLWILGTFVFATFFNWSITARTVLPLAPAVSILLMRHWDRAKQEPGFLTKLGWVGITALISILVTAADYREADASRTGARFFRKRFAHRHSPIWFQSHWGFQFYMEKWHARPLLQNAAIGADDIMVVPSNNADPLSISRPSVPVAQVVYPVMPLTAVFAPGTGAGFYSSVRGPVPWAIVRTTPARFEAVKFR